ncbi:MAG: metallophosphoesterase family protein [Anaerolineae bacterium]|nr:metallophosphoesterase family protein [Anaerolineae bacterium]
MRILVISDIHANLDAFDAVLQDANGQWDYVWCLGDVVGYGPDPNECVERLRELPHLCLAGNHDWAALGRLDLNSFNPEARHAVGWTSGALSGNSRVWLEALQTTFVAGDFTLAHGSPREPVWEYIFEASVAAQNFPHFETPFCLVGHTHQPAIYEQQNGPGSVDMVLPDPRQRRQLNGRRQIINPGSLGQPRDQNPRAAYALLDLPDGVWEYRRVAYDVNAVQDRMRREDFPERLVRRLEYGW